MTPAAPKRPNLTRDQVAKIVELRSERGLGLAEIAEKMDCSIGSVSWALLREGAERKGDHPPAKSSPEQPVSYQRNGRVVRLFTADDDALLLELEALGLNPAQIGKRFDPVRLPNTITGRLRTLARREARREAEELRRKS